jgi:zinc transporter
MEDTKACLFSFALDGLGGGKPADLALIAPDDPRLIWIHLNGRHPDARKFLKDQIHLDPLIVKSLLAEETRPRLEEVGEHALLILRGINFNPGPEPEDLVSIRVWIMKSLIITVGRRKSKTVADLEERIRQGRGPKKTGEFVAMLCNSLHDTIEPVIQDLDESIDLLEDKSLDDPATSLRKDIATLRKQATLFRRHMSPQKDVINRLKNSGLTWFSPADMWYLQDNFDRVTRFIEDLDVIRDRSQIVQDELDSALSSRLNKNLFALSLVTAIFMPLSFISGLLGMNLAGIPAAQHPLAFPVVCGLVVLIGIVEVVIFRKLKWF